MENLKCEFCQDLEDMEQEFPDERHHGSQIYCEECKADYYVEFGTETIRTCNKQAEINHPELRRL